MWPRIVQLVQFVRDVWVASRAAEWMEGTKLPEPLPELEKTPVEVVGESEERGNYWTSRIGQNEGSGDQGGYARYRLRDLAEEEKQACWGENEPDGGRGR